MGDCMILNKSFGKIFGVCVKNKLPACLRSVILSLAALPVLFTGFALGRQDKPWGAARVTSPTPHEIRPSRLSRNHPIKAGNITGSQVIPFAIGDVFAAVGSGQIDVYSSEGVFKQTLNTTSGSLEQTGMCFDTSGNFYSTNFEAQNMTKFDNTGALVAYPWGGPFDAFPENCVVDASNNIYVGEVGGTHRLFKFSSSGTPLATYSPDAEARGTDWMDLAADQHTMYYTSEGITVKRFDVSANMQLPDFATLPAIPAYALRIRSNGELLVAASSAVVRLNAFGDVIQTYTVGSVGESSPFFALNLDPDGESFWTAGFFTGNIYRIRISDGAVLTSFTASLHSDLAGLAVFGEPTAGSPAHCSGACATITGMTFNDLNGNGAKDPGDTGVAGWTIRLKNLSQPFAYSTATDSTGKYLFRVPPGSYAAAEVEQDGWIRTLPTGLGTYTVSVDSADSLGGRDFGNTFGYRYIGPPVGNWSDTANWTGGLPPGPSNPVSIPSGVTVIVDSLPSDSILAAKVEAGGHLQFSDRVGRLKISSSIELDHNSSLEFPVTSDSTGLTCYRDLINSGTISPGHSIVTFAGDKPKTIAAISANTFFHTLEIAGDSTSLNGTIVADNRLILHKPLTLTDQDLVYITSADTDAILDTGRITRGTIKRDIGQGETARYRFETPDTYLRFDGTGTYPSSVSFKAQPDTTLPSFQFKWQLVGGTPDPANNHVTADSVTGLSKWIIGIPHVTGIPTSVVHRDYLIGTNGGSGFQVEVRLPYDQSEVAPGTDESQLRLFRGPCITDTVLNRWNMMSLPLVPEDDRKVAIFPTAVSPAFSYAGSYYLQSTLRFGEGYWLKFASAQQLTVLGDDRERDTLELSPGWNMLGSLSIPIGLSSVSPSPPDVITSQFFGYNGSYHPADSLKPLHAYWAKARSNGHLILGVPSGVNGLSKSIALDADDQKKFGTLSIREAGGSAVELFFGGDANTDLKRYEMPPVPPPGVFDVRYATGRMLEVAGEHISTTPIEILSTLYPLTVEWTRAADVSAALLIDGKEIFLEKPGVARIASPASRVSLRLFPAPLLAVPPGVPKDFSLEQNYPNPFNPTTVIRYQLPLESRVTLKIYDLLGREVKTLVDRIQGPGYESVEWNAGAVASGVYFLRLQATGANDPARSFIQMRKLVLLR